MSTVSSDDANNKSTETFITALVFNAAVAGVQVLAFLIIRNRFKKIYEPRTFLPGPSKRIGNLPRNPFSFFITVLKTPAKEIINKNGLDAYMFLRFLWVMGVKVFLPFFCLTWSLLMPLDAAKSGGNNEGLDKFTFGNVGGKDSQLLRYIGHVVCLWVLTLWVVWVMKDEMSNYVKLRHEFLISPAHAALSQSRTVLLTGIPPQYMSESALMKICGFLPGGVSKIWLARDVDELQDMHDRREKAIKALESGETKLLKMAVKNDGKNKKKGVSSSSKDPEKAESLLKQLVPEKDRPTARITSIPIPLPLVGQKVDKISWAKGEVESANEDLANHRKDISKYKPLSGAFIRFNDQIAAHMFAQCVLSGEVMKMAGRHIEIAPEDVIWSNLSVNPYQQKIRALVSWTFTIALIVFWAIPVAFVGLVSNLNSLCAKASWLQWLCDLPSPVGGIIQGILPPAALAILFMLLPIVLRLAAKFEGMPLRSMVEKSLMTRYFSFLVIHGFLVVTASSGITAALKQITDDPSSTPSILANELPLASNFFLTYIVTTGLAGAAGSLLQIAALVVYYVKLFILGSTPRSVYAIKFGMGSVSWGTLFPNITLLVVIALAYSVISPIINGLAMMVFVLYWFLYKYLFLWVYDMPPSAETGGQYFPKAVNHVFVGLYIELICMIGLFFLKRGDSGGVPLLGEGIVTVILLVVVALIHNTMVNEYRPLIEFLPLSCAARITELRGASLDAPPPFSSPVGGSKPLRSMHHENGSSAATDDIEMGPQGISQPRGNSLEKDHILASSPTSPAAQPNGLVNRKGKGNNNGGDHPNGGSGGGGMGPGTTDFGDQGDSPHAFDHPATYSKQTVIWLPEDPLGLAKGEMEDLRQKGIECSTEGAIMNEKGQVDINRPPPDQEWE